MVHGLLKTLCMQKIRTCQDPPGRVESKTHQKPSYTHAFNALGPCNCAPTSENGQRSFINTGVQKAIWAERVSSVLGQKKHFSCSIEVTNLSLASVISQETPVTSKVEQWITFQWPRAHFFLIFVFPNMFYRFFQMTVWLLATSDLASNHTVRN